MNEVRRARINAECEVLRDSIRKIDKLVKDEMRAHTNLPDSIEHSLYGHGSELASSLMIQAGREVLAAIEHLEAARHTEHIEQINIVDIPCSA